MVSAHPNEFSHPYSYYKSMRFLCQCTFLFNLSKYTIPQVKKVFYHHLPPLIFNFHLKYLVLCQDLVQVKMRNFSHFNPPEAQPQCVFFHTIVRIHLVTYSYNGYEFVSYCRKLPDIQKSTGMLAYNHGF